MTTKYQLKRHGRKVAEGTGHDCLAKLRGLGYQTVAEAQRDGFEMRPVRRLELVVCTGEQTNYEGDLP